MSEVLQWQNNSVLQTLMVLNLMTNTDAIV